MVLHGRCKQMFKLGARSTGLSIACKTELKRYFILGIEYASFTVSHKLQQRRAILERASYVSTAYSDLTVVSDKIPQT